MKDLKYLLAYLLPASAIWGLWMGGYWTFAGFVFAFVCIPIGEALLPPDRRNAGEAEEKALLSARFFDVLLYLNVPILWGGLFYFFSLLAGGGWQAHEWVGMCLSIGVLCGTIGINVAHELGHRASAFERVLAKIQLLAAHYQHFIIEHNQGHHRHVATDADPASARLGESVYAFFWRSVSGSYRHAWHIEAQRLRQAGLPFWGWHNEMLRFSLFEALYLGGVWALFGPWALLGALLAGIAGFLLLEAVNYIEHYGLRRRRLPNGRYEPVQPRHSWNSDHELGRIFLYELTRHADHHYRASRKYQILRHHEAAPQLPTGYPAAIWMALLPPLWFRVMDGRVRALNAAA